MLLIAGQHIFICQRHQPNFYDETRASVAQNAEFEELQLLNYL